MNKTKNTRKRKKKQGKLPCPPQPMELKVGVLHYIGSSWAIVALSCIALAMTLVLTSWVTPSELLALLHSLL